MLNFKIQNCVSLINCGIKIDLPKLYIIAPSTTYNPRKINAVVLKVYAPKATALIFPSGKIVCTGTKSKEESRLAADEIIERIQQGGHSGARIIDFQIQNMVASADVKFHIKLGQLYDTFNNICSYEPELFPGLVFRMISPKVSLIVFSSGKVNITGAKTSEEIEEAFKKFYPTLLNFKH